MPAKITFRPGTFRSGMLSADFNGSLVVKNRAALRANLAAALERAKKEMKREVGESAARLQTRTIDLCPKRTFYMSEHVRADFSAGGYTYSVGWLATDFIGTRDAKGNRRAFYPPFVEFGTRHMRAQPSLSIAYREEEPRFKAALAKALSTAYGRSTGGR